MNKKRWFWIVGGLVLLGALSWFSFIFFLDKLPSNDLEVIKLKNRLTENAKPKIIFHTGIVPLEQVIQHRRPTFEVDDKILRDLNCPLIQGYRYCQDTNELPQIASLGCYSLYSESNLLGGLTPSYPIAGCSAGNGELVYQSGCYIGSGIAYIIERQGKYEIIDSIARLKEVYAPIDSDDEALSYAIAVTGYDAFYGEKIPAALPNPYETEVPGIMEMSGVDYYVKQLENTHVKMQDGEYIVRLYEHSLCGCAYHQTLVIDVAISHQGDVREVYREAVARDKQQVCGD